MKIFCRKGGGLIVSLPFRRRCFCSPPRGGRRQINTFDRQFSIFLLTPREGGDQLTLFSRVSLNLFLLTPPRGGRCVRFCDADGFFEISTRAPARGATQSSAGLYSRWVSFLFTPPRGGATQKHSIVGTLRLLFLLTPPRGGRPGGRRGAEQLQHISTHAPHGGRPALLTHLRKSCYFYSRPRVGGDEIPAENGENHDDISTHAPE